MYDPGHVFWRIAWNDQCLIILIPIFESYIFRTKFENLEELKKTYTLIFSVFWKCTLLVGIVFECAKTISEQNLEIW